MQPSAYNQPLRRLRPMDDVNRRVQRRPILQTTARTPTPASPPVPITRRKPMPRPWRPAVPEPARARWRERLQLPLILSASIIAGMAVQVLWIGIALTLLYGLLALVFRVQSHTTFTLTIIAFVAVAVTLVTKPGSNLANNFAAYAFLLLTIGVITLAIEARPERRRHRRRGR